MKVRELLKKLGNVDPKLDVVCWSEDEGRVSLLEIESVKALAGERISNPDGKPGFRLGGKAPTLVALQVTTDF